jgi:hypothetical protein
VAEIMMQYPSGGKPGLGALLAIACVVGSGGAAAAGESGVAAHLAAIIDWARGFGVTREGGPAVTADTLFESCS